MLTKHPKRTKVVHIRMTVSDYEVILAKAERNGRSVSDYGRSAMLHYTQPTNGTPAPTPPRAVAVKVPSAFLSSADGRGGA